MRKLIFSALVVLCATLNQGLMATPSPIVPNSTINVEMDFISNANPDIDPALVEQIIRYIQQEYDYDYQCLCDQYAKGEMTIEKDIAGYRVSLLDGGGGVIQIIIDTSF